MFSASMTNSELYSSMEGLEEEEKGMKATEN